MTTHLWFIYVTLVFVFGFGWMIGRYFQTRHDYGIWVMLLGLAGMAYVSAG